MNLTYRFAPELLFSRFYRILSRLIFPMFNKNVFFTLALCFFSIHFIRGQALTASYSVVPACSSDGKIIVTANGGVPPYTHLFYYYTSAPHSFSMTSNLKDSLEAGMNVTVRVRDAANTFFNCGNVVIPSFSGISASCTSMVPACPLQPSATVNVSGGTPPFSYLWSNGAQTQTATGLFNGTYTVRVTDANGCYYDTYVDTMRRVTINQPLPFHATMQVQSYVACSTATIFTFVSGGTPPFTYSYNGGTPTSNPLSAPLPLGSATCQVWDATGCTGLYHYTINPNPGSMSISQTITPAICQTASGAINIQVNGGTPPYSYLWSNGATTQNVSNLSTGSYSVQVTDASGCVQNMTYGISAIFPYSVSVTVSQQPTCSQPLGSLQCTVTGGTGPFSYLWNTGSVQPAINGVGAGYYTCTVTDPGGCQVAAYTTLTVPQTILTTAAIQDDVCNLGQGSIQLTASGGTPPYSYIWQGGVNGPARFNLHPGSYLVSVSDQAGCTRAFTYSVGNTSPVNLSSSFQATPCGIAAGSASITANGGTPPYTILWSNGASTVTTAPLAAGLYSVNVTDANGCTAQTSLNVPYIQNCDVTISGKVLYDFDSDCIWDANEFGIANAVVSFNSNQYRMTNNAGNYSYTGQTGNYSVTYHPGYGQSCLCPASGSFTAAATIPGGIYPGLDFYSPVIINGNFDNEVQMYPGIFRPGNWAYVSLSLNNVGIPAPNNTSLVLQYDPLLNFSNCTAIGNAIAYVHDPLNHTLTWNMGAVSPMESFHYIVRFYVPQSLAPGTTCYFSSSSPVNPGEVITANNLSTLTTQVVSSWDPNDKQVFPDGDFGVNEHETLHYQIRFQNTGTDTAFNIVLMDTLDTDLDISTFRMEAFSHPCRVEMFGPGILQVFFDQIMLPDSHVNEALSHGSFAYSIKRKMNLVPGTRIENRAAIYFDYNEPVFTNTTLNTIVEGSGVSESVTNSSLQMDVFPNPSTGVFSVFCRMDDGESAVISIEDIQGRILYEEGPLTIEPKGKLFEYDADKLQMKNGIYFIRIQTESTIQSQKLILTR